MTVLRYMPDYVTDPHRHDGRHDSLGVRQHYNLMIPSNSRKVALWNSLFKRCVFLEIGVSFFGEHYFSNLSLSYDRLCNTLSCHFRVFGTIFFVAHKQAEFLQRKSAEVFLVTY